MRKRNYICMAVLVTSLLVAACGGNNNSDVVQNGATNEATGEKTGTEENETTKEIDKERAEASNITIEKPEVADTVTIEPVSGLSEDFIFGCDMSMLIAQENSGVVYYNQAGQEQDVLKTLADNGVNTIRIRIWNDPYDENGNGYGGGNCDVENAIAIGKRATEYGMSCMIDFHYSDFWADPAKQMCPKEWKYMKIDEKVEAVYTYTKESLGAILEAGVDVNIVQIGNETTSGMSGETNFNNVTKLFSSGSKAVRELAEEYDQDIQVAIHFTNPEKEGRYEYFAKTLADNNVDYDIFASSYYSFWHGTLDNLKSVLGNIIENYGKKVMVAEISYAYTYVDGDSHLNTIYEGAWGEFGYDVSVQGQVDAVRDCTAALAELGENAIGVCYWEPAWIPVPNNTEVSRFELWEKYGSGWASSYASGYDPKDAGEYYGGSAWDNQALFDFEGHPLASLEMFKKMKGN